MDVTLFGSSLLGIFSSFGLMIYGVKIVRKKQETTPLPPPPPPPPKEAKTKDKMSLILVLVAVASLLSMFATFYIDHIVNVDLYHYGLQFTTNWATPYWIMVAIVFSMGWLIVGIAAIYELKVIVHRFRGHVSLRQAQFQTTVPLTSIQTEKPRTDVEDTKKGATIPFNELRKWMREKG